MAGTTVPSVSALLDMRARFNPRRRTIREALDSPLCRTALGVALVVTVTLSVVYALVGDWIGQDLNVYRIGGSAVLNGHRLYDSSFVTPTQLRFTYPPFAAAVFVPLACIPERAAMVIWTLCTIVASGALVAVSLVAARQAPIARRWRPYVVLGGGMLATSLSPIQNCMYEGQVGVFLALMCVADVALGKTRWPRGLLVGLGTALKMTPGLFVLYFALTRDWKAMRTAVLTTVLCWGLTAIALPQDSFTYFLRGAGYDSHRVGDAADHLNESLNGLWHRLPVPAPSVWWLLSSAVVGAWGLWRARAANERGDRLAAAVLVGLTSVLLAPISWLHHAAWVIPAIVVLLCRKHDRFVCVFAAAAIVAILVVPVGLFVGFEVHAHGPLVEVYVGLFVAVVAFLPVGARRREGEHQSRLYRIAMHPLGSRRAAASP